jgi:hypothetical protein
MRKALKKTLPDGEGKKKVTARYNASQIWYQSQVLAQYQYGTLAFIC